MPEVNIGAIIERDVDLLIVEEVTASAAFLKWFVSNAGVTGEHRLETVVHSSTTPTGETDVELQIALPDGLAYILIENKVDAPLQPRQVERYRERCKRYLRDGACQICKTGLVAPAKYLGENPDSLGSDFTVSYEQLLDQIEGDSSPRDPRPFKVAILRRALERGAVGWKLVQIRALPNSGEGIGNSPK